MGTKKSVYYPAGSDMKWLNDLEENEFGSYSVTRLKNMSDADFADYIEKVNKQAKMLENEHWGKAGVASYLKYLDENVANFDNPLVEVDTAYKRLHIVGSDVFTFVVENAYPYDAKNPTFSKEQCAKETLDMVYGVLGANIDSNNFLQLDNVMNGKYQFPIERADVAQYFEFTNSFAKLIQNKYPEGKKLDDVKDHQMRYWLDKPIVEYINSKLPVGEGETKASAYLKWLEEMGIVAGNTAAGYHNRTEKELTPKQLKAYLEEVANQKITANHVEIIFTNDGNKTVSMWNELSLDKTTGLYDSNPEHYKNNFQNIANTDSANYANPNFKKDGTFKNSGGDEHIRLDENPANYDCDLRLEAKGKYRYGNDYKTNLKDFRW